MAGRVLEVTLENFKSYEGRVRVGPFRKFTCIVGPNGAGKSNLVEGISFVLGVRHGQLRGERLCDLIHRKDGEAPEAVTRTASVELAYEGVPVGVAAGSPMETTTFRRVVHFDGDGHFLVNGERVSREVYVSRLEAISILARARNFLILQGDVEAVSQRQGKELTLFFEQVSGSVDFREEYERLAADKAQKENAARHLHSLKRNAMHEQKALEQQRDEAEGCRRLDAKYRALQVEFYLFRLYCVAERAREVGGALLRAEAERERLRLQTDARQRQLEVAEGERAEASLALTQLERDLAAVSARADELEPERVAIGGRLEFAQKRFEDLCKHSEKDAHRQEQLEAQAARLREKKADIEEGLQQVATDLQRELPFTTEQRERFEHAQQEAARLTSGSTDRVGDLQAHIRDLVADRARTEAELADARARRDHLAMRIEDLSNDEEQAHKAHKRDAQAANEHMVQLEQFARKAQEQVEEKRKLHESREQILHAIQDITASERQIEYERRLSRVTADLKQLVPGVHGRIIDLCKTAQRQLNVAVNVAMRGYLDAVVVDTAEAGRQCLRYLKERRLEPMTFLPLDDVRVLRQDRRLEVAVREMRQLRLALSCVSFESRFGRAFEFLLGRVVIADTLEDGRNFAFVRLRELGLSCLVVTLAGETISSDGNLSVSSGAAREGATRFDFATLESNRERLQEIDRRLHTINSLESASGAEQAALHEDARHFEAVARESERNLLHCRDELRLQRVEEEKNDVTVKSQELELVRFSSEEAKLRDEQRELEERIGNAVSCYFAQLSNDMGVDDIQRLEREWRQRRSEAQRRDKELAQRLGSLNAELSMLDLTLEDLKSREPVGVATCKKEIEALQGQEQSLAEKARALEHEAEVLSKRRASSLEAEQAKLKAATLCQYEAKEQQRLLSDAEKQHAGLSSEVGALDEERRDLLRRSVFERVDLPLVHGTRKGLQSMASIASEPSSTGSADRASPVEVVIDFSTLPEAVRGVPLVGPPAELREEEYRTELARLDAELQQLMPNMKAVEQLLEAAQLAENLHHDEVRAHQAIAEVRSRFENVRAARLDRFMECFQTVADVISQVYQRLTANTAGLSSDGGSAYLDLEDIGDPFNAGVKFTVMPPAKRISDIVHLSGGEKVLATMALLFAVHAYQKPPFLLLDEVDAYLDMNNVQALASYMSEVDCQTIVVTLKDKLLSRSEGLIGVSRDKRTESSVALTLDLERLRQRHARASSRTLQVAARSRE